MVFKYNLDNRTLNNDLRDFIKDYEHIYLKDYENDYNYIIFYDCLDMYNFKIKFDNYIVKKRNKNIDIRIYPCVNNMYKLEVKELKND